MRMSSENDAEKAENAHEFARESFEIQTDSCVSRYDQIQIPP